MGKRVKIDTAQARYAPGTNQIVGQEPIVMIPDPNRPRDLGVLEDQLTYVLRPTNRLLPELLRSYHQVLMRGGLIDVALEVERIEREVMDFQGRLETGVETRGRIDYPTEAYPFGEPNR